MAERDARITPSGLAGDGLLLLCALWGLAGSFLSLYRDPGRTSWQDASPLERCAAQPDRLLLLAAVFALLALAAWSLPRFQSAAAGGLTALWGMAVFAGREQVVHGAGLTFRAISTLFARRVSWGLPFDYDPGLTRAGETAAVRLFLLAVLAGLALLLGWAVVRARRWWLAGLFTLPPLLPGLLADLYPDWLPFLALCACWCAMLLTDLCKWAAPGVRGRLVLTALGCSAAVLALITLAFPREGYTRPRWALDAETGLQNAINRHADFFSRWDGPFQAPAAYVGSAGEADLNTAGPLRYTGRTVLRVEAGYEGRLYLRGTSLAVYEDGVWTGLPEGVYQDYLDGLEEEPPFPLTLPTLLGDPGEEHTAAIENLGAAGSCAYAPYFPLEQDWREGGMLPVEDSYLARLRGQTKFTVTFADVEPPEETGPTVRYQNLVYANYLDVPEELEEALAPLAGQVADWWPDDAQTRIVTAQELARLLAERCQYDPQAPAAPQGTDPVEYFLTESRRGYCMHYASAAVLVLRSLGIPARYVSGFTADCAPGRLVNVPDRAAHAWAEIWLDGFGWYPVEVTPAAAFEWYEHGDAQPSAAPSGEPEESEAPAPTPTPEPEPSQAPGEAPQGGGDGPEEGGGIPAPLKAALAALGAAALLWLVQFALKQYRARRLSGPDRNGVALYAYRCLLRLEGWGGTVDPRALELAQKAKFSRHGVTREELAELRRLLNRERAELCRKLGPAKGLAFRCLWGKPAPSKKRENPEKSGGNTP